MAVARTEFPEKLSVHQIERMLRFAETDRIKLEEVQYAVQRARAYARSKNKRMADWPSFIRNAWLNGWILEGFDRWIGKRKDARRSVRGDVLLTAVDAVVIIQQIQGAREHGHPER